MKNLNTYLKPVKKHNIRFTVSDRFVDEDGNKAVWEMRPLRAKETLEIQEQMEGQSQTRIMIAYLAEALIEPDLHDKELLDALSEQEGRTILSAVDALLCILEDNEIGELAKLYQKMNGEGTSVMELAEEAKN